jgi:hypothetical protein
MDSVIANETWEVVDFDYGCRPVECKWVLGACYAEDPYPTFTSAQISVFQVHFY